MAWTPVITQPEMHPSGTYQLAFKFSPSTANYHDSPPSSYLPASIVLPSQACLPDVAVAVAVPTSSPTQLVTRDSVPLSSYSENFHWAVDSDDGAPPTSSVTQTPSPKCQ